MIIAFQDSIVVVAAQAAVAVLARNSATTCMAGFVECIDSWTSTPGQSCEAACCTVGNVVWIMLYAECIDGDVGHGTVLLCRSVWH